QVGKDKLGRFCDNIYEFAYSEYDAVDFDWWPNLYEVGSDFKIKMADGRVLRRSTDKNGNDAIDKPLFELLMELVRQAEQVTALPPADPVRRGVQIADSALVQFWVPEGHELI